jgi:hypothetical protein
VIQKWGVAFLGCEVGNGVQRSGGLRSGGGEFGLGEGGDGLFQALQLDSIFVRGQWAGGAGEGKNTDWTLIDADRVVFLYFNLLEFHLLMSQNIKILFFHLTRLRVEGFQGFHKFVSDAVMLVRAVFQVFWQYLDTVQPTVYW